MFSSSVSSASPPADARFVHAKGVLSTSQGDTTVLLDVEGGLYFTLNEVGGRIWELAGQGEPLGAIVDRLRGEYEVDVEQLEVDVGSLVARLTAAKLLDLAR